MTESIDTRLDSRTYEQMYASMQKFEVVEENVMQMFCEKYVSKFGGISTYSNYGFRNKGLERDITKTNADPDFIFEATSGPYRRITVEVQAMQYDRDRFHLKKSKLKKVIETDSLFIQLSGQGTPNERFAVIDPDTMRLLEEKSFTEFGIVGYPGTFCREYPKGKKAYRFLDGWLRWNLPNGPSLFFN